MSALTWPPLCERIGSALTWPPLVVLGQQLLVHLPLLLLLLDLGLLVDLLDGFGPLICAAGHPVVLKEV